MTRERAKELMPVIQAYAEGGVIEYRQPNASFWQPVAEEDSQVGFKDGIQYRIKPEPQLIPWTMEDVPPVCWLRCKGGFEGLSMVNMVGRMGITNIHTGKFLKFATLLEYWEHSTDLKTWRVCGKEQN